MWQMAGRPFLNPSPPFRAERKGPVAQRREGEVGVNACAEIPHLTIDRMRSILSAPEGGEGVAAGATP